MNAFVTRKATQKDVAQILELYQKVSLEVGGLARTFDEISKSYVENFTQKSIQSGVQWVIEDTKDEQIIAEIHCYQLDPKVFSELTIAVAPQYQGKGLGRIIFQALLEEIFLQRKDILRVELIARESNTKAIEFYQKLGFVIEGRFERRIQSQHINHKQPFEADLPMAWFNENFSPEF
jgi:ribosomal protein S18 acetylase RimI-like enzyme